MSDSAATEDRCSHPHEGRALFDGYFKIVAHSHRQLTEHLWVEAILDEFIANLAEASEELEEMTKSVVSTALRKLIEGLKSFSQLL